MDSPVEHLDVAIIGAGLSGIGAAHRLLRECPDKTFAVFEARTALGGTWDLFRYPGARSDSDMFTLTYPWRPWTAPESIGDQASILTYLQETAEESGVTEHIRFSTRMISADFSAGTSRWTLVLETDDDGGAPHRRTVTCSFLYACTGYYNYADPYQPDLPGLEGFTGDVIHPQFWPADFSYTGKRVVVVGSGATTITLVPEMADDAAHVTMLQRSPSYVVTVPLRDRFSDVARTILPAGPAHRVARARNVLYPLAFYQLCMRLPRVAKAYLRYQARGILTDEQIHDHFTPSYNPWEQRLCVAPDGDFYRSLASGKASVVTERIDRFTAGGVRLASGRELAADVVVTATGLALQSLGGAQLSVEGVPVKLGDRLIYRGVLVSGVPNFGYSLGYTNASWTLRSDLSARYVCRLLKHMDRRGHTMAVPVAASGQPRRPLLALSSGFMLRGVNVFPRQGSGRPWVLGANYLLDVPAVMLGKVGTGMAFDQPASDTVAARNRRRERTTVQ